MTWTIQAGGAVKGTIIDTFENKNTVKSTINLTDGRGNVIFNIEEQRIRQ
jgi:S-adenosylmethionine hydrolase